MSHIGVSILLPHYRTESLARLCLRSIRHYTRGDYEVIVIDNNSGADPALDYLRQVKWIRLIERGPEVSHDPATAHKEALNVGLAAARHPLVLSLHTDTIVIHPRWLPWLCAEINKNSSIAAVGSYKLRLRSPIRLWADQIVSHLSGGRQQPYIRSHCALYKKSVLSELGVDFSGRNTAGLDLHNALTEAGHKAVLIPSITMLKYLVHLNHGTMVLHPSLGGLKQKTVRRGLDRINTFLDQPIIQSIYNQDKLDH